jgi:hypothetical protein
MTERIQSPPIDQPGHPERPFQSTDPVWSDTWATAAVDPDSKQAFNMHILCNSATGKTRHSLLVVSGGRSWRDDTYTDTMLHSDLIDVELDGWRRYSFKQQSRDIDIDSLSNHEPIDFKKLLTFKNFSLGHYEVGCHATGRIGGRPFDGVGLRDRSFGPRPLGGVGTVTTVIMCTMDGTVSVAANVVHGSHTPLANDADTRFAFKNTPEGTVVAKPDEIGIRRYPDGIVESLRLGDDIISLTEEIGHYTYAPHWYPSLDTSPGERKVYGHLLRFYVGHSKRHGRMAGMVDMGVLAPS